MQAAPINTVRAELSMFWAIGAAGFWIAPRFRLYRMAESELFETHSCPEQSNRSLAVQVSSPFKHDMTGSCLLCAKMKLQRGLQIDFSDDDDGDTAGFVASSTQAQSIGQDNAGPRFPMDGLCKR